MQVIRVTSSNNLKQAIKLAKNVIEQGGLIIYPTDTVYGLACLASNVGAIEEIFYLKQRSFGKPIACFLKDKSEVKKYTNINGVNKFVNLLPEKITLVLKANVGNTLKKLENENGELGIRVPDSKFCLDYCDVLGFRLP